MIIKKNFYKEHQEQDNFFIQDNFITNITLKNKSIIMKPKLLCQKLKRNMRRIF